jgi:hypothetical protein
MDARDLDSLRRQPLRYWYVDGIQELFAGVMAVLLGTLLLTASLFDSPNIVAVGVPVLGIGGAYLGRGVVQRVKERMTFPRTGFIERRKLSPALLGLGFGIIGLLQIVLWFFLTGDAWELTLTGCFMASVILAVGIWLRLPRFVALGVLGNAFAVVVGLAGWDHFPGYAALLLGMGAGLLATGATTLSAYLHSGSAAPER